MISFKLNHRKTIFFTVIPILVILILIIYITFAIIFFNKENTYDPTGNATPNTIKVTNTPGGTSTNPTLIEEQKKLDDSFSRAMETYEKSSPLLRYMPVHENLFTIDYLGKGIYRITLLGSNKVLAKEESGKWWVSHQINPDSLNIEYVPEI